jgi:cytochrome oxidase assembly protein ShyY1
VWRMLRRPRWLGYLALAVVFAVVSAGLGAWQWSRHEDRVERRDLVRSHYDAPAVPVGQVLAGTDDLQPQLDWTRVEATGSYLTQHQHLVRNRPHQGTYGYAVLVPLDLGDGTALTVDRGWVPNAPTADQLPEVPPAPAGAVTVTGWLRPSEPDLGRDLPAGQLASIDLPRLAEQTGLQLAGGYLVLGAEDPSVPRPVPLDPPDTGLGSHFAYALQWWLTAPVGLVLVLVTARREHRGQTTGTAPARADRPRKVRIWDEEDA